MDEDSVGKAKVKLFWEGSNGSKTVALSGDFGC